MSKYIDLAEEIHKERGAPFSCRVVEALCWLDDHPDQVPGRTITESDYSDITEWARNYSNRGWEGRAVLAEKGITIVPDPKPTNKELLEKILYGTTLDISREGLAITLDRAGVKAPGGDDE